MAVLHFQTKMQACSMLNVLRAMTYVSRPGGNLASSSSLKARW